MHCKLLLTARSSSKSEVRGGLASMSIESPMGMQPSPHGIAAAAVSTSRQSSASGWSWAYSGAAERDRSSTSPGLSQCVFADLQQSGSDTNLTKKTLSSSVLTGTDRMLGHLASRRLPDICVTLANFFFLKPTALKPKYICF